MNAEIGKAITHIHQFTNRHRIDAEFFFHSVSQLRTPSTEQSGYWSRFEKRGGVYCIFKQNGSSVQYIGMSGRDTGSRLFQWLFAENKVSASLTDEDLILSVVLANEPYMACALESYLIPRLRPDLNVAGAG